MQGGASSPERADPATRALSRTSAQTAQTESGSPRFGRRHLPAFRGAPRFPTIELGKSHAYPGIVRARNAFVAAPEERPRAVRGALCQPPFRPVFTFADRLRAD